MSRACAGTGLAHVFLDFIVLLLPLPVIWRLHTTSANKVTFTIVFTIGIFATICSVLRIGCLVTLLKIDEADFTGSGWLSILFEVLEVNLGILCICIPTFPPVWVQVSRSGFGSYAKYLLGASQRSDPESGEGKAARWNRGASLPRSNEFERLDDSRTHIVRAEPGEELPMHALGRGDVNVTRGWEVKRG
ncbi:MAG: hypothetical protein M1830_000721 [Pleopsidium flavum]|nr:MAG: hypothetical protein M1830_000721 [Pleopsidium flavum]